MQVPSWALFHICPCCAMELFPDDYVNENGMRFTFGRSNQCLAAIKQELQKAEIEKRRKHVKEKIQA